jgi:uncharacterized SAM-binding protein YcdF (DUF218 family)
MMLGFNRYEAVVVLGAQIVRKPDRSIMLAFHTEMRARAAGVAYRSRIAPLLIVSGGHNVGVRYSLRTNTVFPEPNLSPFALIKARLFPSEARVIAEFLHKDYAVHWDAMILEEKSVDTDQNADNCKRIIERRGLKEIALLTSLYHMEKAAVSFRRSGLDVKQLYAEDLLITEDQSWIDRIVEYYMLPRGDRSWDTRRIHSNLQRGESIAVGLAQGGQGF